MNPRIALAIALVLGATPAAQADLVVPAGGQFLAGGGQIDLGCTDTVIAGTLPVAGGAVFARHVAIQPGGTIDGGTGVIQLGGDWSNGGTFVAGTSTVRFTDACVPGSGSVSGSTVFFNARFASTTWKTRVFQVGTTQTIGGLLEILGTVDHPIQFRSSTPGQVANIDLLPAGMQSIQHVGVTDVWATGQPLAPDQANEGGGGNAANWFGSSFLAPSLVTIPALGELALPALAVMLAAIAIINLGRRAPVRARSTTGRRPAFRIPP